MSTRREKTKKTNMFAVTDHDGLWNDEDLRCQLGFALTTQIDEQDTKVSSTEVESENMSMFGAVGKMSDIGGKHLHRCFGMSDG